MLPSMPRLMRMVSALLVALSLSSVATAQDAGELKVMTFNILYATAENSSGDNAWDKRKDLLVETIKGFDPDLLGTQETLFTQRTWLEGQLPDYETFGVGVNDGKKKGVSNTIFFRKDRFTKLDGGHFWLSEQPTTAGSKSWDSASVRMATWLKLRDTKTPGQPIVWYLNTHLDHKGKVAREEAAKILHKWAIGLPADSKLVITGDFNCNENSPPHKALFAPRSGKPFLQDSFRVANPKATDEERSYNGLNFTQTKGKYIDWIAASPALEIKSCAINRTHRNEHYPSDHFPVQAVLGYRK